MSGRLRNGISIVYGQVAGPFTDAMAEKRPTGRATLADRLEDLEAKSIKSAGAYHIRVRGHLQRLGVRPRREASRRQLYSTAGGRPVEGSEGDLATPPFVRNSV